MAKVYYNSQSLLCGPKCACNLASTNNTNLNLKVPSGAYNVFQCPNSGVQPDDAFSKVYIDAELNYKCAGLCSPSPYFVFTNVNNGVPTQRCYEQIKRKYQETLLLWIASCLTVVLITAISQGIIYLLLVY